MEQIELISRIKTLQNLIFWTSIWAVLIWGNLISKFKSSFWILFILFLIFFSYTLSSIYFIRLGRYVGNDIFSNFMNFYNKYPILINQIMKIFGYILFAVFIIWGGYFIIKKLPDNYIGNRIFQVLVGLVGTAIAIILAKKKFNGPKEN